MKFLRTSRRYRAAATGASPKTPGIPSLPFSTLRSQGNCPVACSRTEATPILMPEETPLNSVPLLQGPYPFIRAAGLTCTLLGWAGRVPFSSGQHSRGLSLGPTDIHHLGARTRSP